MVLGLLLRHHQSMSDDPSPEAAPSSQPPGAEPVVRRDRSNKQPPPPSLAPPLLSGRSLEPVRPVRKRELFSQHRAKLAVVLAVLLVVGVLVAGKLVAENAADSATEAKAASIAAMLDGADPDDFLAFNAGVQRDGSLAQLARDEPGFMNVKAVADLAFIRFQPEGWWSGFTERCVVVEVRPDELRVSTPKTACIRVEEPTA